jgi:hypothetical protein
MAFEEDMDFWIRAHWDWEPGFWGHLGGVDAQYSGHIHCCCVLAHVWHVQDWDSVGYIASQLKYFENCREWLQNKDFWHFGG